MIIAAFLGAVFGLGVFLMIMGLRGVEALPRGADVQRLAPSVDHLLLRIVFALTLGSAVGVATGWPVAVLAASLLGFVLPSFRRSTEQRRRSLERTEAVATWSEMLRDTMAAAAGLNEAIVASSRVAPPAIRAEAQALAIRAEHQPLPRALRRFATDLADPVADAVCAALILSTERQGANLGQALTQIASNARDQAAMRQRVEASRARTYASARFIVVVTLAFSAGLVLFAPQYLEPFDSVEGQLTLTVVFGLFGAALWGLHRLAAPQPVARLLAEGEVLR